MWAESDTTERTERTDGRRAQEEVGRTRFCPILKVDEDKNVTFDQLLGGSEGPQDGLPEGPPAGEEAVWGCGGVVLLRRSPRG